VLKRRTADGALISTTIDLWQQIATDHGGRDLALQDGDILFVPKLAPGDPLDRKLLTRSALASRTVRVRVIGEVRNPGEVEVLSSGTLGSALAVAGGPTDSADLDRVAFARMGDDGRIARTTVNLSGQDEEEQVQEGDILYVPKHTVYFALDFLDRLFAPIFTLVRIMPRHRF